MSDIERLTLQRKVPPGAQSDAVDFLAEHTGLSKSALKDAMIKGAVWLKRGGQTKRRLRRAKTLLHPGDLIECYYDRELLQRVCPEARLVSDLGRYSVWFKPAGVLTEGTSYGDFCALERHVEKAVAPARTVLLVHRLDRETPGLMAVAHDRSAAAALSALFQRQQIEKRYRAEVKGNVADRLGARGEFAAPLDGKPAQTLFTVAAYDPEHDTTTVDVRIVTGRMHQIRRHFADAGFPVLGDPRYGRGNSDPRGLRLLAYYLAFRCPLSGKPQTFVLDPSEFGYRV